MLPETQMRLSKRIINGNAGRWLTVTPKTADHTDLSPNQFKDALSFRYGHTLRRLPVQCDGYEAPMNLTHALNYKKGGLVNIDMINIEINAQL